MTPEILCVRMVSVYKHIRQNNEHLGDKFELETTQPESHEMAGSM